MNIFSKLKGAIKNMLSPASIETVLQLQPAISTKMRDAITEWEDVYENHPSWAAQEGISPLGLGAIIAGEKAQTATLEMKVKITGENERAKFISDNFKKVTKDIRTNLEYGIALGGLVIKPYVHLGIDGKYTIDFTYVKAGDFYPLTFQSNGEISEAAFVDRVITKKHVYSKLEHHKLEGSTLIVTNRAFKQDVNNIGYELTNTLGTEIPLSEVTDWEDIEPVVRIENVGTMLFAYFKMPIANNVDKTSPLGISGFARAINLIRDADEQYSNMLWEFKGGQLAIDVDRTALNPVKKIVNGKPVDETPELPVLQQRLFRRNLDLGDDNAYNVFSPALRDVSILNGLNHILAEIEDACAISRGTLSETNYSDAKTATELKILKQRSYSANQDIQAELERTLRCVLDIMNKYCDLYEIVGSGSYEAAFDWDDSILVDKDAERQVDLLDVEKGLLSRVEYRMKWYGETEAQAEEAIKRIDDELTRKMTMQQQAVMAAGGGINNQPNNKNDSAGTDAEAKNNKLKRANESGEKTDSSDPNPK